MAELIKGNIVYEPKGRARELAPLAANLYHGCDHGCKYCYAPAALRMQKDEFYGNPTPRKNVIELLEKDLAKMQQIEDEREILLCFACDPYQQLDEVEELTREAVRLLCDYGRHFAILTKGGARSFRDFDYLERNPELCRYGATLVFADDAEAITYEPGAAPTSERIDALRKVHELGVRTFVSLEPVWRPEDAFQLIVEVHGFVDHIEIGKLNHHAHAKTVNWKQFKKDVVQLCEDLGLDYHLKKDLEVL